MTNKIGKVYLIPCPLGDVHPLAVLPLSVKQHIENIDHYIVEHEKEARRFIKSIVPEKKQSVLKIQQINKFTSPEEIPSMLDPCFDGFDVGVISDAGCPGIADPGARIVANAHEKNIKVVPLVGPSSLLLGMMASGFNGQNFAFNGYLPIEKGERRAELKRLEKLSKDQNQSQLFIETPYRNNQLLESMVETLNPRTKISVACDLTLATEYIKTSSVEEWKKIKVDLHKRPTLFILQG
ncbi:MAG TPA: SAM-dependent methyltransferase [Aequorivita sp.]|nr:SAM-dependent methyltransferase [Aequorivita sp.]